MKRLIIGLGIVVLATVASAQVDPTRTVASVNGEEIKGSEYYYRMEFLPGVGKVMGNAFAEFPPGFITLEQLITEKLVFQLAKQQGVYPSDLEVQDELATRLRTAPNLVSAWKSTGRTEEELTYQVRFELAKFNVATAGVTITDVEVADYYKKNPDMFTVPKQLKLRVIVVRTADDQAVVNQELAAKKPFSEVAAAHSQDATRAVGGDYGTVPITVLGAKIKEAIEGTKIGQDTDWIASTNSATDTVYVKFHIEDIIPPKLQSLDTDLKRTIRHKMMLQKGAVKNDVDKEMAAQRSKAKIDIKEKTFADAYKKFIDAYLKQQGN